MKRTISRAAVIAAFVLTLPTAFAATPQATDLTNTFRGAGAAVDQLQVYEIAGIVILRGRVADVSEAAALADYAQSLGYARVANLIQITPADNDQQIERLAERELTIHRSLDGCQFQVQSTHGVLHVAGKVRHELQKDVAVQVLRNIDGVRSVQLDLRKF
ncbi:MAG TPA: BON domain-containing protein [Thermoanaerobaculia bacterium]|jgi:osmotically-inducible protein OsmY